MSGRERRSAPHRLLVRRVEVSRTGNRSRRPRRRTRRPLRPARPDPRIERRGAPSRPPGRARPPRSGARAAPAAPGSRRTGRTCAVGSAAADLEQVAKAARRDQRDPAALALDQRVGADRGAMREAPRLRQAGASLRNTSTPSRMARPGSVRGGWPLVQPDLAARLVEAVEIGERPADVHADRPAQGISRNDALSSGSDRRARSACPFDPIDEAMLAVDPA